jgi:hypothetical protein
MRNQYVLITLLFLVACGKPDERCRSREEMRLSCQAEEIANLHYPTQWEINRAKEVCERQYVVNKCY